MISPDRVLDRLGSQVGASAVNVATGFRRTTSAGSRSSAMERFKQLDQVAGRVLEEDLLATLTADDVAAEAGPCLTQPGYGHVEVVDVDLGAVPTSRLGPVFVGLALPNPPPPPGVFSSKRKLPRCSIAKPGTGCIRVSNARCVV